MAESNTIYCREIDKNSLEIRGVENMNRQVMAKFCHLLGRTGIETVYHEGVPVCSQCGSVDKNYRKFKIDPENLTKSVDDIEAVYSKPLRYIACIPFYGEAAAKGCLKNDIEGKLGYGGYVMSCNTSTVNCTLVGRRL